jgi:NAD-dependent SIR2 family protein deacetylase
MLLTDLVAGVPPKKLVEAHGSFNTASCTRCGKVQDAKKVHVRSLILKI